MTHVPSRYARTAELEALCAALAKHDAIYATHSRGNGFSGAAEAADLGRASGAKIQYSHVALNRPEHWGSAERLLDVFGEARHDGVDIACDVYPYDASASALTQYLPAWVQEGGVKAMSGRLADPAIMQRAEDELAAGWGADGQIPWFWDRVMLARTDVGTARRRTRNEGDGERDYRIVLDAPEGISIEEAAAHAGVSAARYVLELCREGGNRVQVVLFYRTEADMRAFLRYEHTVVGSDGSAIAYEQHGRRPHPRAFGAHARVLGRYTRELADLDLATAVHKMTGAVADRMGITDRGTLQPGRAADIVIFDPGTVTDNATFGDPCRAPSGIAHVVVNGEIVIDAGVQTSARPGKVLRSR